jgi:predicted nuclease of predicted toxin-antitoxin system
VKFLLDAQLPRAASHLLRERGHESEHTLDLPEGNRTTDRLLLQRADSTGAFLVTKDSDFVVSRVREGRPLRLLLISVGNSSNVDLFSTLTKFLPDIEEASRSATFLELTREFLIVHE